MAGTQSSGVNITGSEGARTAGGISGEAGRNVSKVNKPANPKAATVNPVAGTKPPTAKQLSEHYKELYRQWNH